MTRRDVRAWALILGLVYLDWRVASWSATHNGAGFFLVVLLAAITLALILLWARTWAEEVRRAYR